MQISSLLIDQLPKRLPDVSFRIGSIPDAVVVFPAAHPGFGDVEVYDDGDELTVNIGNFTHSHFSNYSDASDVEKAKEIVESTLSFLSDIFKDHLVFWGSHKSGGGGFHRDEAPNRVLPPDGSLYVWSGPYGDG